MKTTTLFACALLLNCATLFAQSRVSIGLIGGPMAANFRNANNTFIKKEWVPSFSVGTAIRVGLSHHVFFQTDVSYERKGFGWKNFQWTDFNGIESEKFTVQNQFDYLTLAPTIGFTTQGKIHLEGSVGIFAGYLVRRKDAYGIEPPFASVAELQPNINDFNRFDFGTTSRVGVGFDIAQKWSISVNAIGNLGLLKPYRSIIGAPIDSGNERTLSLGLQLGLFYKI